MLELLSKLIKSRPWLPRNKLCFEKKTTDPSLAITKALSILHTYQHANVITYSNQFESRALVEEHTRWIAPENGRYKLTTDMAKAGDLKWGAGMIVRDDMGRVMATGTRVIHCPVNARVAESLGLRLGLMFAKDLCFQHITAESDCKELIDELSWRSDSPSQFRAIVDDYLSLGSSEARAL